MTAIGIQTRAGIVAVHREQIQAIARHASGGTIVWLPGRHILSPMPPEAIDPDLALVLGDPDPSDEERTRGPRDHHLSAALEEARQRRVQAEEEAAAEQARREEVQRLADAADAEARAQVALAQAQEAAEQEAARRAARPDSVPLGAASTKAPAKKAKKAKKTTKGRAS